MHYLESPAKIGLARYGVPIIKKKLDEKTKILAVAELKNINSVASYKHLKIGKKHEKSGYFSPSNGHHRRVGRLKIVWKLNFLYFTTYQNLEQFGEVVPQILMESKNITHIYI